MGSGHSHVTPGMKNRKPLFITLCLGLSILVVQTIGALLSGSVSYTHLTLPTIYSV